VRSGSVAPGEACRISVSGLSVWHELDVVATSVHPLGMDDRILMSVHGVRRGRSRREAPRALVAESAVVESSGESVDVDIVDLSAYGFAFSSRERFEVGESLAAGLNVDRQVILTTARVINLSPMGGSRVRVGCRFTHIAEHHRALLDQVAAGGSRPSGVAADRRSALLRRLGDPKAYPAARSDAA
jgi:PilZ domain